MYKLNRIQTHNALARFRYLFFNRQESHDKSATIPSLP